MATRPSAPAAGAPIGGSGMRGRVLVAIPAIAFAIFLIVEGGLVFAAGVGLLGLVCLHELFGLYPQTHPARLAGFAGLLGLLAAAHWGDPAPSCSPSSPRCRSSSRCRCCSAPAGRRAARR